MPPIKSTVSKHYTLLVLIIILFSKIMPSYSRYTKKKLQYITITALFNCQSFSYIKCTKYNISLFCDI